MSSISISKSINRILKTPLGSRVLNPTFGSKLYELRDRSLTEETKILIAKYSYEAVKKWEKRVTIQKVQSQINLQGVLSLEIYLENGEIVDV